MARTRTVFPRDTVAHLWAHAGAEHARDAADTFYFNGRTLYSYGSHYVIAHIFSDDCGPELAGRVLWNDKNPSNTTSKHKSHAWRALTSQQRANILHVQDLDSSNVNEIVRALQEKRLPAMADKLITHVVACVAGMAGKRIGAGPWEHLMHLAQSSEATARAFYARAGRKYPLPIIADSRPVMGTKEVWAAWIKSMASGKFKGDYAAAVKAAKDYAAQAEKRAAEMSDGFPYVEHAPGCEWEARNVVQGTYDAAGKALQALHAAYVAHTALHGDKPLPVALRKLQTRMTDLQTVFAARRDEFAKRDEQGRVMYAIREGLQFLHKFKARVFEQTARFRLFEGRKFSDMETLLRRAEECGLSDSLYLGLAERLSRIGKAHAYTDALTRCEQDVRGAASYLPGHPGDAMREARNALRRLQFAADLNVAEGLQRLHAGTVAKLTADADTLAQQAREAEEARKAAAKARDAETLRAWLAGESNVRPGYDAGTYARIKGDVVETTRGASVPIEHACRLARMYAIAVRRGGQQWADGNGPRVGHYHVNSIGADGSLVIGCHEFDPAEAKRLHDVLQSCEACAKVQA